MRVSRETIRRWPQDVGYVWKRARHVARDDDPQRVAKLARIRSIIEGLRPSEALFFADELDIHLLAKIGYEWMLKGTQTEVMTPGTNRKHYLAGALNYPTGKMLAVTAERKDRWLFIDLLKLIDKWCPAAKFTRIYVVCDNGSVAKIISGRGKTSSAFLRRSGRVKRQISLAPPRLFCLIF